MLKAIEDIDDVAENLEDIDPHFFEPGRVSEALREATQRLRLIEANIRSVVNSMENINEIVNISNIKSFSTTTTTPTVRKQ